MNYNRSLCHEIFFFIYAEKKRCSKETMFTLTFFLLNAFERILLFCQNCLFYITRLVSFDDFVSFKIL